MRYRLSLGLKKLGLETLMDGQLDTIYFLTVEDLLTICSSIRLLTVVCPVPFTSIQLNIYPLLEATFNFRTFVSAVPARDPA